MRRAVDAVLVVGWLALTAIGLLAFGAELAFHLGSPAPTTLWENGPLQVAMNAAHGGPMYADWLAGPVQLAIYGPLYHGILALVAALTGSGPLALAGYARLVGIVSIGVAFAAAARFVRAAGAPAFAAFATLASALLVTPTGIRFIASARPDATAVAFSVLAMEFAFGTSAWTAVAAGILLAAAVLTKMTAVSAAAAIGAALLVGRRLPRLAIVGGVAAASTALVLGVLQLVTGGWMWRHLMVPSAAPMRLHYLVQMLSGRSGVLEAGALAVFPVAALLTAGRWTEAGSRTLERARWLAAASYFVASWLVALATATHQGSDQNYLIEPAVAAGMVFGLWAARVASSPSPLRYALTRALAAVALVSFAVLFLPGRSLRFDRAAREVRAARDPYGEESDAWIRSLPQPLLALSPWVAYRAGVANDLNDPIAYVCMLHAPADDVVTRRVAAGAYRTIVVSLSTDDRGFVYDDIPRLWPALRQAIDTRYLLRERHAGWSAYEPR